MLEQLKGELLDIEAEKGASRKTINALTRINYLLPLVENCPQSMTKP